MLLNIIHELSLVFLLQRKYLYMKQMSDLQLALFKKKKKKVWYMFKSFIQGKKKKQNKQTKKQTNMKSVLLLGSWRTILILSLLK